MRARGLEGPADGFVGVSDSLKTNSSLNCGGPRVFKGFLSGKCPIITSPLHESRPQTVQLGETETVAQKSCKKGGLGIMAYQRAKKSELEMKVGILGVMGIINHYYSSRFLA